MDMEDIDILDAHVHLGPSGEWVPYVKPSVTKEEVMKAMDDAGIERSIVFPNPVPGDRYPEMNDIIAEAVENYPDRLIGFGRVDPRRGDEAVEEIKRCAGIGLVGIKLHPFVETYRPDHPHFERLFDTIYELDMIILSHTGTNFASPGHMGKVLEEREEMKLILGHLNEGCISVAGDYDNTYVDTSGSRVYMLDHAVEKIPEKIVFGSDFPYLNYEVQKKVVEECDCSDRKKKDIFRDNLLRLLK